MDAPDTNLLTVPPTPHHPTAGGAQMGAAHTSANHQHLSQELSGKVIYDDLSVFNRLRVFDEDATIIADCHKGYKAHMKSNIDKLVRIAIDASKYSAGVDPEGDGKTRRKQYLRKQEQLMYKPLVRPTQYSTAGCGRY